MTFGYFRSGANEADISSNVASLVTAGATSGNIFFDKEENSEFLRMLEIIQNGDEVLILRVFDISRDLKSLFRCMRAIHERGGSIRSLSEPWFNVSQETVQTGWQLYKLIEHWLELASRTAGIRTYVAAGKRPVGRPKGSRPEMAARIEKAFKLYDQDEARSVEDICRSVGVNQRTFYRHLSLRPTSSQRRPRGRKS